MNSLSSIAENDVSEIEKALSTILHLLAEDKLKLKITRKIYLSSVTFEVSGTTRDRSVLIGKGGSMAAALRTILHTIATKRNIKAQLIIAE